MIRRALLIGILFLCSRLLPCNQLLAQGVAVPGDRCKPMSERTQEIGCWILADDSVGQLTKPQMFWHLDTYPTRSARRQTRGRRA